MSSTPIIYALGLGRNFLANAVLGPIPIIEKSEASIRGAVTLGVARARIEDKARLLNYQTPVVVIVYAKEG